jgi:hypothetical protein
MDKFKACCGSCCGCFGNVMRTKACLYALMFICFFWAAFDLVLSSMSVVNQVYDRDPNWSGYTAFDCSVKDFCAGKCLLTSAQVPNPLEYSISDKNGKISLKVFCTWPIGPNSSRFCCAICTMIMFVAVGVWACRTPYPKYTKIFHVILFLAADVWWWAVMVTDATLVIQSNNACKSLQSNALLTPYGEASVRLFR